MAKGKKKRKSRISSGKRAKHKAHQIILRLTMKMNRWKRYAKEISIGKRKGSVNRWLTTGIEKHIAFLEKKFG